MTRGSSILFGKKIFLVGKMEVWILEGFIVAHNLREMLIYKSVNKYLEMQSLNLEEQYRNLLWN